MNQWDQSFAGRSPILAALRDGARAVAGDDWPATPALQAIIDGAGIHTVSGLPLRLVTPDAEGAIVAHELRLYLRGELEFRERNWHDLLNVLVWLMFPYTKAALNARHFRELTAASAAAGAGRGTVRDALTLFDESGIIVLSTDAALLGMIRGFLWKPLFWDSRSRVVAAMRFVPFGHALYEKALAPFKGITGRALLLEVKNEVLDLAPAEQLRFIDGCAAARIADPRSLLLTTELAPLPVLGVPGWCRDNEHPGYYDDRDHFRPGRLRDRQSPSSRSAPSILK